MGWDGIMCLCLDPSEYEMILESIHVSVGGFHYSGNQTTRRVTFEGFWWKTLYKDAKDFVKSCQIYGWLSMDGESHINTTLYYLFK